MAHPHPARTVVVQWYSLDAQAEGGPAGVSVTQSARLATTANPNH